MKKIKKIILVVIVSLIALISVFSCFKGKYTPEPILTPVSVLKPANSTNDNVINPTGTYETFYFNTSLSVEEVNSILDKLSFVTTDDGDIYYNVFYSSYNSFYAPVISIIKATIETLGFNGYVISLAKPGEDEYFVFSSNDISEIGLTAGWSVPSNPFDFGYSLTGILDSPTDGQQNNLLTNLISPVPFLFEGTSNSIAWTSSGLDNPNNIQNIYFNTNLTNQAIKNALDTYIGDTSGVDIFYYLDTGIRVRCHVINNSANAFIQIIGGSTTLFKWIYDSIDTDDTIWWYGIDPQIIDNNNVIVAPNGIALEGFNIYELRCLFSSANDFTETPSEDSYEQGYQDGYTAGETSGYNQGYTAGETAGYNQGYLDGLDDGAGSNVNFQYIESVLTLIGNFLNIEILPNIKLSYALGIVIILSIISIVKMVVK